MKRADASLEFNGSSGMPTRGALTIRDLVKIYDPEGVNIMAVDHCSMQITPGEFCMIVGPSGCGKTTLLNAIAGFHSITSGEIFLDDKLLCGPDKPIAAQGADRIVVFHDETAADQGVHRYARDFHAFERRNLATGLELSRRDRILAIEVNERNIGIRARQQSSFGGIEAERLGRLGRRQTHVVG